jgi:hypothetical protein
MVIKLQIIRDNSVIWPKGVLQTKPLTRNAERNLKQSKDTMLLKRLKTLKNIYIYIYIYIYKQVTHARNLIYQAICLQRATKNPKHGLAFSTQIGIS